MASMKIAMLVACFSLHGVTALQTLSKFDIQSSTSWIMRKSPHTQTHKPGEAKTAVMDSTGVMDLAVDNVDNAHVTGSADVRHTALKFKEQLIGVHGDQQFFDPDIVMELRCVHCIMKHAKRDYMITEGTLLAAARNGFLLPWDADGDFAFDGREGDYGSFYKLFSPGPMSTASKECPSECHVPEVHLFMGAFDWARNGTRWEALLIEGAKVHYWQSYPDLLSGNLRSLHDATKRKAPEDLHKRIIEYIKLPNPARLHKDGVNRDANGYLDLVAYELKKQDDGSQQATIFEAPTRTMTFSQTKSCNVRVFGKDVVETLELSCPMDPSGASAYLAQAEGKDWQGAPFNKFDGKKWVLDKNDVSLEQFLRKQHNYTGPLEPAYTLP